MFDENPVSIGIRPKQHSESTFEYYNRSLRTDIRVVKQVIEEWFAHIPDSAQHDLRQRFRSRKDSQHRAATFELFLHELFTRIGFSLQFHPEINGRGHPDFLVRKAGRDLFYLEATTAGASIEEAGQQRRIDQVYDAINHLKNSDFYLSVFVKGAPTTPPRGSRLKRDLERWLGALDWQTVRAKWEAGGFDAVPFYEWQHDGWEVTFKPIPKSEEHRGEQAVTPIGLTMPLQAQRLAPDEGIKNAIEAKNKYDVSLPLLLAVNLMEDFCKTYDVMNALFGHETVVFSANGTSPGARLHDGAWDGPRGPQNRSISTVLIFHDLQVWNIKQDRHWIIHNPWSAKPLSPSFLPFSQYVPDLERGTLQLVNGSMTVGDALGLPDPWPPEELEIESQTFQMLRSVLASLSKRISVAFVFGSMARQDEKTASDIDLMVVGKVSLEELVTQITNVERLLGKAINPNVYSVFEFKSKLASGNHFLNAVMQREKVFLIGDEDELRKVAGNGVVEKGAHQPQ